jgi:hypothetical protein
MKTKLRYPIIFLLIVIIVSSALPACSNRAPQSGWADFREDTEWVASLNKYLSLVYVEEGDRAAFTTRLVTEIAPSLYTTYAVIRLLKSQESIENKTQIVKYINSLRNQEGAYVESYHSNIIDRAPLETKYALSILTDLNSVPEDSASTIKYLLSLQYDDGTFVLDKKDGITPLEDTRLKRIGQGTASVIKSLAMLEAKDKIPEETKNAIQDEVAHQLGTSGEYPDLLKGDSWGTVLAIQLLAITDPDLVTERARRFIADTLVNIVTLPADPYLSPDRTNNLLDIAQTLGLPEANDPIVSDSLRTLLKEKLLPMQNITGGFGPSYSLDPLATSANIILAARLGVPFPNYLRLEAEIEKHWVGSGWTPFFETSLSNPHYKCTYWALETAAFSGFKGYNKDKINKFLRKGFSSNSIPGMNATSIMDIYYCVKGLKLLNGKLNQTDLQSARTLLTDLSASFSDLNEDNYDSDFIYTMPLSKELDFDLPNQTIIDIVRLAGIFQDRLIKGKTQLCPSTLLSLYNSVDGNKGVLSPDEIVSYLEGLYDEETGFYTMSIISNFPPSSQSVAPGWTPTYAPHPLVEQTLAALTLLSAIGKTPPDINKTYNYLVFCKRLYGFSSDQDSENVSISSTPSAILLFKIMQEMTK